jgi:8-oxo-dGTP pyrophosphatase MutT (NUDIX family)
VYNITVEDIRSALALSNFDAASAQLRMAPKPRPIRREGLPGLPRLSAVLMLIYPMDGELHFVLIRRTEYKGVHSGQISFPGGKREGDETFQQNALRETFEEIGVADQIEILGQLTPIYVPPSDFEIHPFVGYLPYRPNFVPNPAEVAEIIEPPVALLFDDQSKGTEALTATDGITRTFPFYRANGYKVWGATAAMLSEVEERLRVVMGA